MTTQLPADQPRSLPEDMTMPTVKNPTGPSKPCPTCGVVPEDPSHPCPNCHIETTPAALPVDDAGRAALH